MIKLGYELVMEIILNMVLDHTLTFGSIYGMKNSRQ